MPAVWNADFVYLSVMLIMTEFCMMTVLSGVEFLHNFITQWPDKQPTTVNGSKFTALKGYNLHRKHLSNKILGIRIKSLI